MRWCLKMLSLIIVGVGKSRMSSLSGLLFNNASVQQHSTNNDGSKLINYTGTRLVASPSQKFMIHFNKSIRRSRKTLMT